MDIVKLLRTTGAELTKRGFVHHYEEAANEIAKLRLTIKENRRIAATHMGALRVLADHRQKGRKS